MPRAARRAKDAAPPDDWNDLHGLDRKALAAAWERAFGRPIPRKLFRNTAIPLLAYRLQELQHGGLSPAAERHLISLLPKPHGTPARKPTRRLRPGTRLLRTWKGRTYAVTVADNGFIWNGYTYRSLSVIARKITGTAWSGPAFFGLKQRPDARKATP